jgi:hypothetical protein
MNIIELHNHFIKHELSNRITQQITSRFNDIIIEGLERKGYVFPYLEELEDFVRSHCNSVIDEQKSVRIFYVKEQPFLIHHFKPETSIEISEDGRTASATLGHYQFV